jgi:hypothetical protein
MIELFMVEVKRTPQGTRRIKERIAAGKCVLCDTTTDMANPAGPNKHECERCRSRLRRLLSKLPKRKQVAMLANLIRTGYQLEPQEIRMWKPENKHLQQVFEEVAS